MGNLCSIFHSRYKNLIKIIPSAKKAQLVDYILFGWQTSKYRLKNSDQKWFMKHYKDIVLETGIGLSTIQLYIKELADEGYIVRRQAMYSRTTENGSYESKKGNYIYFTDKFLFLLKQPVNIIPPQALPESTVQPTIDSVDLSQQVLDSSKNPKQESDNCPKINNNKGIDPLEIRGSYIRDLYSSFINNTISFKKFNASVDNPESHRYLQQFSHIETFIKAYVKEELPTEVKKIILGTFFNISFKHRIILSNPQQVVAEYLFALFNTEFYMPKVQSLSYRNNILAKLLRDKAWKTPKGFYKHCYLGREFKNNTERENAIYQEKLARELEGVTCPIQRGEIETRFAITMRDEAKFVPEPVKPKPKLPPQVQKLKDQLEEVNSDIHSEGLNLQRLLQKPNAHDFATVTLIECTKKTLDKLFAKQQTLEQQLNEHLDTPDLLCA